MSLYMAANLIVVLGYYVLIGRHLQRKFNDHTLAAFFILAPAGLCALSVACFAVTLAATLIASDSSFLYLIVPAALLPFCLSEIKAGAKARQTPFRTTEAAGLLLSIFCLYPILLGCYQGAINPSLDHDALQYIGYSQDILKALPDWNLGANWQAASNFKIPHSNLYPSVLVWASLVSGPSDILTDAHIKIIPSLYTLALFASVAGYGAHSAKKLGLAIGILLIWAVPSLEYSITSLSIDGFYLLPLTTIFFMLRNRIFSYQLASLLCFLLLAHTLGAIYAAFFFSYYFFSTCSQGLFANRTLLFTSSALLISLIPMILAAAWNQDAGFHYKYYSDPLISSELIHIGAKWREDVNFIEWISIVFEQYAVLVAGLIGFLCIDLIANRRISSRITWFYILFITVLYCLTLRPETELLGKAFQGNFRYSLGLKVLAVLCLFDLIQRRNFKFMVGLFCFACCYYFYEQGMYDYGKYFYQPSEAEIVKSIIPVCDGLANQQGLSIFTNDIRINRICGSDYAFIFSENGLTNLRDCKDQTCLFLSRNESAFSNSLFMRGAQPFEVQPNKYSLTAVILSK